MLRASKKFSINVQKLFIVVERVFIAIHCAIRIIHSVLHFSVLLRLEVHVQRTHGIYRSLLQEKRKEQSKLERWIAIVEKRSAIGGEAAKKVDRKINAWKKSQRSQTNFHFHRR